MCDLRHVFVRLPAGSSAPLDFAPLLPSGRRFAFGPSSRMEDYAGPCGPALSSRSIGAKRDYGARRLAGMTSARSLVSYLSLIAVGDRIVSGVQRHIFSRNRARPCAVVPTPTLTRSPRPGSARSATRAADGHVQHLRTHPPRPRAEAATGA